MGKRTRFLMAACCAAILSACASSAPPLSDERTAVIPGRDTANLNATETMRTVLLEGARITVDHGYQYFVLLRREVWTPGGTIGARNDGPLRPGEDVTIKVFHDGEVSANARGVYEADKILTGVAPRAGAAAYSPQAAPSRGRTLPPPGTTPGPRCTAYGCSW